MATDLAGVGGRTAPPALVRALKEVDPTAELVYVGGGGWQLMRLRPKTDARLRQAGQLLARASRMCQSGKLTESGWVGALRRAELLREGYIAWPGLYRFPGDPDYRIVRDFREARWRMLHERDLMDQLEYQEDHKSDRAVAALTSMDAAKEASRAARNPHTLTVPGLKERAVCQTSAA